MALTLAMRCQRKQVNGKVCNGTPVLLHEDGRAECPRCGRLWYPTRKAKLVPKRQFLASGPIVNDSPLATASPEDLAWLAGILDRFLKVSYVQLNKGPNGPQWGPRISITFGQRAVAAKVARLLTYRQPRRDRDGPTVCIQGWQHVALLLKYLRPYLVSDIPRQIEALAKKVKDGQ